MTWSHAPSGRLPLLSARPAVTFPAKERHRTSAGTKLYCLATEAHACEQLAQGCYLEADRPRFEPATFWIASERATVKPHRTLVTIVVRHLWLIWQFTNIVRRYGNSLCILPCIVKINIQIQWENSWKPACMFMWVAATASYLVGIYRQRMHRVDDHERLAGVAVHQIASVALTECMQDTWLVEISQLSEVFNAIKLRRICLQTTTSHQNYMYQYIHLISIMSIGKVRWIYRLQFVCVFVQLRISPPRIKLTASHFLLQLIGVQGRKSHIFVHFAPPEAQNWTNRPAHAPRPHACKHYRRDAPT